MTRIACNASPIIALSSVGLFHVLGHLFDEVMVPKAMLDDILPDPGAFGAEQLEGAVEQGGVHSFQVQDQALVEKLSGRLHRGELEVIIGAVEQGISTVILDHRQPRMLAQTFKLDCTGTLGILLTAKAKDLIPEVKKSLDGLSDRGFRLSDRLYREVLEFAGIMRLSLSKFYLNVDFIRRFGSFTSMTLSHEAFGKSDSLVSMGVFSSSSTCSRKFCMTFFHVDPAIPRGILIHRE